MSFRCLYPYLPLKFNLWALPQPPHLTGAPVRPPQRHRLARLFLPEMPGVLSGRVFRCFKTLERLGDKITGFAGPWFVALAWILLSYGVLCFLDVVLPTLAAPVLTTPLCMLLVVNMLGNYYWACFMPPGMVGDEVARRRPWLYAAKKASTLACLRCPGSEHQTRRGPSSWWVF